MMPVSDEKLGDVVHDEKIRKIGNRLDYGWAVAKAVRDLCTTQDSGEREALEFAVDWMGDMVDGFEEFDAKLNCFTAYQKSKERR